MHYKKWVWWKTLKALLLKPFCGHEDINSKALINYYWLNNKTICADEILGPVLLRFFMRKQTITQHFWHFSTRSWNPKLVWSVATAFSAKALFRLSAFLQRWPSDNLCGLSIFVRLEDVYCEYFRILGENIFFNLDKKILQAF